jgi:hypothetical protein
MDYLMWGIKIRRAVRKSFAIALEDFFETLFNKEQLVAFLFAVVATFLALENAALPKWFEEAREWRNAITAFSIVALAWGAICIVRSPLLAIRQDHKNGKWFGRSFVYHEPMLIHTVHCDGIGTEQKFAFTVQDVEPNSLVSFTVKYDGSDIYPVKCGVFGWARTQLNAICGDRTSESRLDKRQASFHTEMPITHIDQTFRIYVNKFEVGPGRQRPQPAAT